jgi:hypothetical protein
VLSVGSTLTVLPLLSLLVPLSVPRPSTMLLVPKFPKLVVLLASLFVKKSEKLLFLKPFAL